MANIITTSKGFIEVSLDGTTPFDITADLSRPAPNGMRIKSIRFDGSAGGDWVIVRDGIGGPAIYSCILGAIGVYNGPIQYYRDDTVRESGKEMSPYIAAAEVTVAVVNAARIVFEL